jgi:hypothetical protein
MQFDRVIRAQIQLVKPNEDGYIQTLIIEKLRIAFSIFKSESFSTNTANIRIYNLGADKRNQIAQIGDQVRLEAGYREDGGPQLIFLGQTTQTSHLFAQPEIITVLDCGDGDKTLNNTTISVSFGPDTPARTAIQSIASQMGLIITEFAPTENLVYTHGYSDSGLARDILQNVADYLDLQPTVQNGNLLLLDKAAGSLKPPVEINANTGMIGIPERYTDKKQYLYRSLPPDSTPKPGWKVRTLLRPDILPGDRIRLRSTRANVNGDFIVVTARHEGDNYGPNFETTFEVVGI